MTAGTAGTEAGAEADQQAGDNQQRHAAGDLDRRQRREQPPGERRDDQAEGEGDPPGEIASCRPLQQAAENAADAGDAAVDVQQHRSGEADQQVEFSATFEVYPEVTVADLSAVHIERPVVTVWVDYPGAAPETMDAEVTRVLEGAAARVTGVESIRAASEEGNARMFLDFDPSVDVNIAANDVREAIAEVEARLRPPADSVSTDSASAQP